MLRRPALCHSPSADEVRDLDLGVKFSDFYLLAMNSKTKCCGCRKRYSGEPDGAPGPLLVVFGPALGLHRRPTGSEETADPRLLPGMLVSGLRAGSPPEHKAPDPGLSPGCALAAWVTWVTKPRLRALTSGAVGGVGRVRLWKGSGTHMLVREFGVEAPGSCF